MNRRDPLPELTPQEILSRQSQEQVAISHPALDEGLLAFPALSTGSTATPYGVFGPLVLDACRVLTNHAAKSQGDFLASDRKGRNRIVIRNDTVLDVDCYYFLGPPEVEANRNYPIVTALSAFTFPSVLPDRWARIAEQRPRPSGRRLCPQARSQLSALVEERDKICAVTRYPDSTQCAHLIPEAEAAWFFANKMDKHIRGIGLAGVINHPANGILLRADVRLCLDSHGFVFYPDSDPADDQGFVAYFVQEGYSYLPELFHRRPVTVHPEIPVQFLYARFAYAIINHPRENLFFDSIPESPMVKVVREGMALEEQQSEDPDVFGDSDDSDMCAYDRFRRISVC